MQRSLCQPSVSSSRPHVNARAAVGPTHLSRRNLFGASIGLLTAVHQPGPADAKQLIDLVPPTLRQFDDDGDGSMSVQELQQAYNKVGSPQVLKSCQARASDFDGSERVSTEEWLRSMSLEHPVDDQWMEVVDENGDDYVGFRELRAAIGDLGGGDAADIIQRVAYKQADSRPRDGRLSREEAQKAMDLISAGMQDEVRASMQRRLSQR
ncbi:hypothetical protein DUNSADRAFT_15198 [Dunaliella salina]|uniref:EF-hand domain-containing protein n=1 Tax=Dunaliella salina TaxID=3046 RepID=A0ABQ7G5W2_DUNSA|nr:hypothetical protein DUNSADRAFT_15198 [Dunaliella salina]|eukprot:KAF5829990.1 hypothetical protein DUNSADRAFT_15198 [Dunaliella salina]